MWTGQFDWVIRTWLPCAYYAFQGMNEIISLALEGITGHP